MPCVKVASEFSMWVSASVLGAPSWRFAGPVWGELDDAAERDLDARGVVTGCSGSGTWSVFAWDLKIAALLSILKWRALQGFAAAGRAETWRLLRLIGGRVSWPQPRWPSTLQYYMVCFAHVSHR